MITVHQLEVRVGARLLMENVSFRVGPGDKVGLVGRNGAGKTTLTKVLAGDALPASGSVTNSGELGYLPQDPRVGDPEVIVRDRILSARGLDDAAARERPSSICSGVHIPASTSSSLAPLLSGACCTHNVPHFTASTRSLTAGALRRNSPRLYMDSFFPAAMAYSNNSMAIS